MYTKKKTKSYLTTNIKSDCTGCKACVLSCPINCISMKEDEEGFEYPFIDSERCINCKKCILVCPKTSTTYDICDSPEKQCVAAVHKNEKVLEKSSSGGAFVAIAATWNSLYDDLAVFGVNIDENFNVKHESVCEFEKISKFQKSKYVLSDVGSTYHEVKELLANENTGVLYTGTPCQISGLKTYLGKDYDNLLCVDLFCHGAGNQKIFKKYIEEENNLNSRVATYSFREKFNSTSRNVKITYDNGEYIVKTKDEDLYMSAYFEALFYRPLCLKCIYASEKRYGDITIGDAWKIKERYPQLDANKGVSAMLFNNKKGLALKEKINEYMEYYDIPYDFLLRTVDTLREPTRRNSKRKKFFKLIEKLSVHKSIEKCLIKNNTHRKIISKLIPAGVKTCLKNYLKFI